jgi:hypothetical protein
MKGFDFSYNIKIQTKILATRFFYDQQSKKCKEFEYTGHGGNDNNFESELDCLNDCFTGNFSPVELSFAGKIKSIQVGFEPETLRLES